MKNLEILPGKGWGDIRFGMSPEQIIKVLGKPNEVEEDEDQLTYFHYDELIVSLTFDGSENGRLASIVLGDGKSIFFDNDVFVLNPDELQDVLRKQGCKNLSIEGEENKVIESEDLEMLFWFEGDDLMEIQWGPFFADEEQIIWPV